MLRLRTAENKEYGDLEKALQGFISPDDEILLRGFERFDGLYSFLRRL